MYKKFEIKIILSNFTGQNRKIKTTIDMEIKKTEKANLENKKLLFTEIGLIVSLLIVFIAFEWTQAEVKVSNLEDTTEVVTEEEIIPITQETPPPPPSAPKIPILSDQIDIVDDEIEVNDDLFISLEDTEDMGVEIMDYVAEVYEEEIDHIIGVVNQKDFHNYVVGTNKSVTDYIKPVVFVPGGIKASALLKKMQQM